MCYASTSTNRHKHCASSDLAKSPGLVRSVRVGDATGEVIKEDQISDSCFIQLRGDTSDLWDRASYRDAWSLAPRPHSQAWFKERVDQGRGGRPGTASTGLETAAKRGLADGAVYGTKLGMQSRYCLNHEFVAESATPTFGQRNAQFVALRGGDPATDKSGNLYCT
jgi:hypothetical protein